METISVNEIKVSDLQKSITNLIAKEYLGYTIKNAYKVEQNKVITYDVNVTKGTKTIILSFDKNCSFIAVIEPEMKRIIKLVSETKKHKMWNNFKQKINKNNFAEFSH
jgi:hypothetical protein